MQASGLASSLQEWVGLNKSRILSWPISERNQKSARLCGSRWRNNIKTLKGPTVSIPRHASQNLKPGHLQNFTDPLVDCKLQTYFVKIKSLRANAQRKKNKIPGECKGELTPARQLIPHKFKQFMGPVKISQRHLSSTEIRQAFTLLVANMTNPIKVLPVSYRSEKLFVMKSPGNFTFRTREFETNGNISPPTRRSFIYWKEERRNGIKN